MQTDYLIVLFLTFLIIYPFLSNIVVNIDNSNKEIKIVPVDKYKENNNGIAQKVGMDNTASYTIIRSTPVGKRKVSGNKDTYLFGIYILPNYFNHNIILLPIFVLFILSLIYKVATGVNFEWR